MKVQYNYSQLVMLPETNEDEMFAQSLTRLVSAVSNRLMAWYGDCEFDGKATSGYKISFLPDKQPGIGVVGKMGGLATSKKYGKAHYQKLAENMNKKLGRNTSKESNGKEEEGKA